MLRAFFSALRYAGEAAQSEMRACSQSHEKAEEPVGRYQRLSPLRGESLGSEPTAGSHEESPSFDGLLSWLALADTLRTESLEYDDHKLGMIKEVLHSL